MSGMNFISFPRKFNAFLLSDIEGREKAFGIMYDITGYRKDLYLFPDIPPGDNMVVITDKNEASFCDCFANPFIYGFSIDIPSDLSRHRTKIATSDLDDDVKQREIQRINDDSKQLYLSTLHDFIHRHIKVGEFVEIYKVWTDHINYHFDSPTSETTIDSKELSKILDSPEPSGLSIWDERRKYTIVRTV